MMQINSDFSQRVVVRSDELEWTPSPMPGVDRKMLDRIGDEVARATTIVRFAPDSAFSAHTHDGGEEFLVLDGVFSDEHGDFPAGSYIRNPPTSSHTPFTRPGATILVKLHQFDPADRTHVRVDITKTGQVRDADRPGVSVTPLFEDAREQVRIERLGAGVQTVVPGAEQGAELFVLEGEVVENGDRLGYRDWLRSPSGRALSLQAGPDGATLWVKSGHLAGH